MMADAFATRPREVAEMIRELIDPSYYNSGANSLKEAFLANMYRIVSAAIKKLYSTQFFLKIYLCNIQTVILSRSFRVQTVIPLFCPEYSGSTGIDHTVIYHTKCT